MHGLKKLGPISAEHYQEVVAEAAYLSGRGCNSIRRAWDDYELPCNTNPQGIAEWVQANIKGLANLEYLGSEKHPQTSYKRARFGGVTHTDLEANKLEFLRQYGMEFGSVFAERDFKVLQSGLQHNLRWQPENSTVPLLRVHYNADAHSRRYALGAQGGDTPLLASTIVN